MLLASEGNKPLSECGDIKKITECEWNVASCLLDAEHLREEI